MTPKKRKPKFRELPPRAVQDLDGFEGMCPTCGSPGRFDTGPNKIPVYQDWIAWNYPNNMWECDNCWLK